MKNAVPISALAVVLVTRAVCFGADSDNGFKPLFNGKDLTGWKLRRPDGHQSWSVKDSHIDHRPAPETKDVAD